MDTMGRSSYCTESDSLNSTLDVEITGLVILFTTQEEPWYALVIVFFLT